MNKQTQEAAGPASSEQLFGPEFVSRAIWELEAPISEVSVSREITEATDPDAVSVTNPGLADALLAEISRLGHRDLFARPYDWENLIAQLELGEELLWIVEKRAGQIQVHFGVKFGTDRTGEKLGLAEPSLRRRRFQVLSDALARRCFPESHLRLLSAGDVVAKLEHASEHWGRQVTCIAGVPSPKEIEGDKLIADRDEKKRPFASLNDVTEALVQEGDFALVFSMAKALPEELLSHFRTKALLRDRIHPFVKWQVGENWGIGHETGRQKGTNTMAGIAEPETRNIIVRLWQGVFGASRGKPARVFNESVVHSESLTEGDSVQSGGNISYERMDTLLESLEVSLDHSMKHLEMAMGTGGYFCSVMVYAGDREASRRIGKTVASVLSGSKSYLRPMQILPFHGPGATFQLNRTMATHKVLARMGVYLEPLDSEQAGRMLLLPDAELPGLHLRRNVFYGRPPTDLSPAKGPAVALGQPAFTRRTIIDELEPGASAGQGQASFTIPLRHLQSHLLLAGTTGSGKTVRAARILNELPLEHCRVIVLETAKKTYRDLLRRKDHAGVLHHPRVFTLGDSTHTPFRVNPFFFDPGTSLKQHISVLADAVCELLPVEALIGPKLREAAEWCYTTCGWDIESGRFVGEGEPVYPDMIRFNLAVHETCRNLDDYGPEVRANYKGALLNRARIFVDDVYQDIFATSGNMTFGEIFAEDTIIEMEEMPPSEINMPAFIVSLVLQRLRAFRFGIQAEAAKLEHEGNTAAVEALHAANPPVLLVVEEAHNVLHRKFEQSQSDREAGKGGRLVEQMGRLMAEGRALGIGVMVVDQSPKNLADAVIANANTKIVFRQEDGEETRSIGTALGMAEDDWPDLLRLDDGECVVKSKAWPTPVKLAALDRTECPEQLRHPAAYAESPPLTYGKWEHLLSTSRHGWSPPPSSHRTLAKALLHACRDDMDLVRYALAKHWLRLSEQERAAQALAVTDYAQLKEYLLLCAKAAPPIQAFCSLLNAIAMREPVEVVQEIHRTHAKYYGVTWISRAAGLFIQELEALVTDRWPEGIPPGDWFFRFRDALLAWVEELTGEGFARESEETGMSATDALVDVVLDPDGKVVRQLLTAALREGGL